MNVLRLNGWEVTEAQMEAIPNGCWIGSEVHCMCLGVLYYSYYNYITFKVISFFMKLLKLEHSMAIRETRSKKIVTLLSTYFYQCWASFISRRKADMSYMSEIHKQKPSKITEHPCNEIKVHPNGSTSLCTYKEILDTIQSQLHAIPSIVIPLNVEESHWIFCVRSLTINVINNA